MSSIWRILAHEGVEEGVDAAVDDGDGLQDEEGVVEREHLDPGEQPALGVDVEDGEGEERSPAHEEHEPHRDQHSNHGHSRTRLATLLLILLSSVAARKTNNIFSLSI